MRVPPESQARSPIHTIPFEVLEVEFVWYGLEMEIALQTQGQMAGSRLERGTRERPRFVCSAGQTADTEGLHSSWDKEFPHFPKAGKENPHLGDFTLRILRAPQGSSEIWG